MKATIEISDDLYRLVKAKSALEGRAIREVTEELYQRYVAGELESPETPPVPKTPGDGSAPSWFGMLRRHTKKTSAQDMDSIRASIAAGIVRERDL